MTIRPLHYLLNLSDAHNTGLSKKMDGIWNRYNLKSTGRIYTFAVRSQPVHCTAAYREWR
jgi:hypothetical protein